MSVTTRLAARRHDDAPLARLLHHPEGRAVWDGRVAPSVGRLGSAALAAACKAGRDYRRGRVMGGEEELRLNRREAYQSPGELRVAVALGGLELNHWTVYSTVEHGTAEALAWLIDTTEAIERCDKTVASIYAARADSESVAKLEVLHERVPGEWDVSTCYYAADFGCMDALVWLHEHGAPWDKYTCSCAAYSGELEVLRYAREHGCPWDRERCLEVARENEHEHVVAWIDQQPA